MSSIATSSSVSPLGRPSSGAGANTGTYQARRHFDGSRGLAALLLAAAVAAMVVLADRLISTWADGHLLLAWVFLWVVVFAGLALFAGAARNLARSALRSLDGWSQALAEARAEARMWEIARQDPRVMNDLLCARMRAEEPSTEVVAEPAGFSEALAPLGMEAEAAPAAPQGGAWDRFVSRQVEQRSRNVHLYYV